MVSIIDLCRRDLNFLTAHMVKLLSVSPRKMGRAKRWMSSFLFLSDQITKDVIFSPDDYFSCFTLKGDVLWGYAVYSGELQSVAPFYQ